MARAQDIKITIKFGTALRIISYLVKRLFTKDAVLVTDLGIRDGYQLDHGTLDRSNPPGAQRP